MLSEGLTYEKLGEKLDYAPISLSNALQGHVQPGKRLVKAVENFFGESWGALMAKVKRGDTI